MSRRRSYGETEPDYNDFVEQCFDSDDGDDTGIAADSLELVYSEDEDSDVALKCDCSSNNEAVRSDPGTSGNSGAVRKADATLEDSPSRWCSYILESFQLFFSQKIVDKLVAFSNEEADRRNVQATNAAEVYAYMGVLLSMGAFKDSRLSIDNLWGSVRCRASYIGVMSRERFRQLTCILRFDDPKKIDEDCKQDHQDKFSPMRQLFQEINELFSCYFVPGPHTAIGEMLSLFRGNCPFQVCMRDKPGKYGILIRVLTDVQTKYIINMEVETSETPREEKDGALLIRKLVRPIAGSGRSVTTGQQHASVELAQDLWQTSGLTLIGAVKKRDDKIADLLRSLDTEVFATKLGRRKISFVPIDSSENTKRKDLLLSTYQDQTNTSDVLRKNDIKNLYNKSKICVDEIDQMLRSFSVKRGTRRWPLSLFYTLIDIVAFNSYILFTRNCPEWCTKRNARYEYLVKLGNMLVRAHVQDRTKHAEGLHKPILTAMELILDGKSDPTARVLSKPMATKTAETEGNKVHEPSSKPGTRSSPSSSNFQKGENVKRFAQTPTSQSPQPRKRCYICTRNAKLKNCKYSELSKSKQRCCKCSRPVCQKHSKRIISCLKCDEDEQ